jgi:hypothetical protein
MKRSLKVLTACVILGFWVPKAEASFLFTPGVRYESVKIEDNAGIATDTDSHALTIDGRAGIVLDVAGIYVGGLYRYEDSVSGGSNKIKGSAYGPSAGIVTRQFALIGTYLLNGERTYSAGAAESKLSQGKGVQFDVMYVAGVTETFGIGPQLTYRDVKFEKSTPFGAVENDNTVTETTIEPGIVLWWRF